MTTVVTISTTAGDVGDNYAITLSDDALARARRSFNPSGNRRVDALKCLAAAFYTELESHRAEAFKDCLAGGERVPIEVINRCNTVGREAGTAATHIQAGAMFAVSAVTA